MLAPPSLVIERLPRNATESQRVPTNAARIRCKSLTSRLRVGTIRLILSDFVGQHRRRSTRMAEPTRVDGLSSDRPQGHRRRGRPHLHPRDHRGLQLDGVVERRAGQRRSAAAQPAAASPSGTLSVGSYNSDPGPKQGMADINAAFKTATGITVTMNTVDHGTFQDQISNYLGATPDTAYTWFSGFRMKFFADQGFNTADRRRLGEGQGQLHRGLRERRSSATTRRSTGSRSTTTRGRSSTARASSRTRSTPSRRPGTSS